MRLDSFLLGSEAVGDRHITRLKCLHLPVKPVKGIGAKAIRPREAGSEVPHAKPAHPFYRLVQPVILEVKPLTQSQDVGCLGPGVMLNHCVFLSDDDIELVAEAGAHVIHDPTSNFKIYSRRLLDRVTIESEAGFELALEPTVKAHLLGLPVAEVPTTWKDRTAGESHFQMWKWLPHYLHWYRLGMLGRLRRR